MKEKERTDLQEDTQPTIVVAVRTLHVYSLDYSDRVA